MVTINNKIAAQHYLKITIDGSFNEKDISKLIPLIYDAEDDKLNLMVVLKYLDISGSFSAVDDKLKAELVFLKKLKRCAFVTEKKWLQWIAKAGDIFLPSIIIKTFDLDEQEAAKKWLLN